jgi:hypothetical protein
MNANALFAQQATHYLEDGSRKIEGTIVENNKYAVSLHFRNVDQKVVYFSIKPNYSCVSVILKIKFIYGPQFIY